MPQCCKANEFGGWCSDLKIAHKDEISGNSYCVFHAPKGMKGISLDEFNAEVFKKIDDFFEKHKNAQELQCDFSGTIFEGDIDFSKYYKNKPLSNIYFEDAQFTGITDFNFVTFNGMIDFQRAHFEKEVSFWMA